MAGIFDSKYFNAEVFQKYMETVPNTRLNMLLQSRAIRTRPELATSLRDSVGGNYLSTPLRGLIGGTPQNYDGNTDIVPTSTDTYMHSRVVVGRSKAWEELDFSYDITGGEDFMQNVANQVNDYWNEVDQNTIVSILKGVFSMTGTQNAKFVTSHTMDISGATNDADRVMNPATLNNAIQQASGDQKSKFTMIIMHSAVATNLENLQLLQYVKGTDANGLQREMNLATLNGRLVMIDDSMPVEVDNSGSSPVTKYTSFILGDGAIEYTDCGAKVPYEMDRDPAKYGGKDILYTRQRKCWSPYGISFIMSSMASTSPTDAELENGANWTLVSSAGTGSAKKYIDMKAIPIARIISLG